MYIVEFIFKSNIFMKIDQILLAIFIYWLSRILFCVFIKLIYSSIGINIIFNWYDYII